MKIPFVNRINYSIGSRIIASFVLVFLLSFFLVGFMFFSNIGIKKMYNQMLDVSVLYSQTVADFEKTDWILQRCAKTGKASELREFSYLYPKLIESVNRLERVINQKKWQRNVTDLKYMMQTYVEAGTIAVDMIQREDYPQALQKMVNVRKLKQIITEQFNRVHASVLEYSFAEQKDADAFYFRISVVDLILIICGFVGGLFMIRYTAKQISDPMTKLSRAASEFSLEEEKLTVFENLDMTTSDEIGVLAHAFKKMQKKISQQYEISMKNAELQRKIDEDEVMLLKSEKLMKDSQLRALQSQINPHFLFNTLNLISNTAYFEGATQTVELMESLNSLMRYNLDNISKTVTIADEIACVNDYIMIQQKRFGDRIHFEINVQENTLSAEIPCLILQPLIENALKHGVNGYVTDGKVGLSIKKVGTRIEMAVYDNGKGMNEERLIEVRDMANGLKTQQSADSIGVSNVFERLRLLYGSDISIEISSIPGVHTEFRIDIPLIEVREID